MLRDSLTAEFARLGFEPDVSVPYGAVDHTWWFSRLHGSSTEAICCEIKALDARILAKFTLFVSEHSLPELLDIGLSGNAAGYYPFTYQAVVLERDIATILPQIIELPLEREEFDRFAPALAARIAREIRSIDHTIWEFLRSE